MKIENLPKWSVTSSKLPLRCGDVGYNVIDSSLVLSPSSSASNASGNSPSDFSVLFWVVAVVPPEPGNDELPYKFSVHEYLKTIKVKI